MLLNISSVESLSSFLICYKMSLHFKCEMQAFNISLISNQYTNCQIDAILIPYFLALSHHILRRKSME